MKISVLIVAHNEERYIGECIQSILNQTKHPDEIVVLVHSSTDKTGEIAEGFPVTVVPLQGPEGIVDARVEGLDHVSGDVILCIDGDAYARENWVEVMSATLKNRDNVLVGSWVKLKGTLFGNLYNMFSRYAHFLKDQRVAYFIWGSSYAFWGRDKNFVKEILKESVTLSAKINLERNPEDYWRALFLCRRGGLEVTNKTFVTANTKDITSIKEILRRIESYRNRNLIRDYFNANLSSLPL